LLVEYVPTDSDHGCTQESANVGRYRRNVCE
jgi:hypothetical protein